MMFYLKYREIYSNCMSQFTVEVKHKLYSLGELDTCIIKLNDKIITLNSTGELDANRPVPFRLTPNIAEFLTSTGVTGPLTASMVASARCFVQPQYKLSSFLRAILRDEYITWHKKVSTIYRSRSCRAGDAK